MSDVPKIHGAQIPGLLGLSPVSVCIQMISFLFVSHGLLGAAVARDVIQMRPLMKL